MLRSSRKARSWLMRSSSKSAGPAHDELPADRVWIRVPETPTDSGHRPFDRNRHRGRDQEFLARLTPQGDTELAPTNGNFGCLSLQPKRMPPNFCQARNLLNNS